MYYTIHSNLLGFILFVLLIYATIKYYKKNGLHGEVGYHARFEIVCVIDLLLTFGVYWIMLVPQTFSMDENASLWTFKNLAVHLVTPLLCLIDYILFTPSGHLQYKDVYYVLIYPLFYVVFSSVVGFLGYVYRITATGRPVRFPYFFYDFDEIGLQSLLYIAILAIIFLLISHIFYWIDKKVKKPQLL